jgi:valyl-tRNA synthetase
VVQGVEVHVPLAEVIDLNAERQRLHKELAKTQTALDRIAKKLGNEAFLGKAPAEVVDRERTAQTDLADQQAKLAASLAHIEEHVKNSQ